VVLSKGRIGDMDSRVRGNDVWEVGAVIPAKAGIQIAAVNVTVSLYRHPRESGDPRWRVLRVVLSKGRTGDMDSRVRGNDV
jgi:hypothetical protein